jgi:hypothetical protein
MPMILLRTKDFGAFNRHFADQLSACNERVACVVDERFNSIDVTPWPKVSLTVPACEALGLYCPADVGWRCGDYGLYLARKQFPDERFFWMIEPDVRFGGGSPKSFFSMFAGDAVTDLLALDLRAADGTWFWEHAIAARDLTVFRCLFALVRLSDQAIDDLLDKRALLSRRWARRLSWPNDESFVSTVLMNNPKMTCRDLNDFGNFYDAETVSYHHPFDGDQFQMRDTLTVYHPVLFGSEYRAKLKRLEHHRQERTIASRVRRRLAHELNVRRRW